MSQLVRESDDKDAAQLSAELENTKRRPWDNRRKVKADFPLTRIARASVEGAAQLFAYEASREYVYTISPYFQSLQLSSADTSSPLKALLLMLKEAFISADSIPSAPLDPGLLL